MKKNKLVLVIVSLVALFESGCGRNYGGTYVGTQTLSLSSMAASTAQVSIVVNPQSSNNMISGTWSGAGGNGTWQGTTNGDMISNVTLSYSMGVTNTSGMAGIPNTCGTMQFTGNLTINSNRQLSGSLMTAGTTGTNGYGSGPMCSGSLSVTATNQNQ